MISCVFLMSPMISCVFLMSLAHAVGSLTSAPHRRPDRSPLLMREPRQDSRPASWLRLRGGEDDATALGLKKHQVTGRMSNQEVLEKLNKVPVFCIMESSGSIISLPDGNDGDEACTWYLDPHEAVDVLKKCRAANPGDALRLVAHRLGDALQMCGGWPGDGLPAAQYDGKLNLKPHKAFAEPIQTQLVSSVRQENLEPGAWVVPTFVAEELAQAGPEGEQRALPIYLSPLDLRDAYAKAGVLNGQVAQTGPRVLELRVLVKHMLDEPKEYPNAWRAVEFVPTPQAIELVQMLDEQQAKSG